MLVRDYHFQLDEVMKQVGTLSKAKDAYYMCLAVKELIEQVVINYKILSKIEDRQHS